MGARGKAIAAMFALVATGAQAAPGDDALFGAHGYRVAYYRAPVPKPPHGVGRIAPAAVALLRPDIDAILIDVLPAEGGHREADGRWNLARERPSIPGAHWFPEAGRGDLSPANDRWFHDGLVRLTGGATSFGPERAAAQAAARFPLRPRPVQGQGPAGRSLRDCWRGTLRRSGRAAPLLRRHRSAALRRAGCCGEVCIAAGRVGRGSGMIRQATGSRLVYGRPAFGAAFCPGQGPAGTRARRRNAPLRASRAPARAGPAVLIRESGQRALDVPRVDQ